MPKARTRASKAPARAFGVLAGAAPTRPTLTGVHAPEIEPPMIHLESGVWFVATVAEA